MGYRITQRIYQCDKCGRTPEDGEYMWHMGNEIWCKKCCDEGDEEDPGTCIHCGKTFQLIRPGKSQPTCDCY